MGKKLAELFLENNGGWEQGNWEVKVEKVLSEEVLQGWKREPSSLGGKVNRKAREESWSGTVMCVRNSKDATMME